MNLLKWMISKIGNINENRMPFNVPIVVPKMHSLHCCCCWYGSNFILSNKLNRPIPIPNNKYIPKNEYTGPNVNNKLLSIISAVFIFKCVGHVLKNRINMMIWIHFSLFESSCLFLNPLASILNVIGRK